MNNMNEMTYQTLKQNDFYTNDQALEIIVIIVTNET